MLIGLLAFKLSLSGPQVLEGTGLSFAGRLSLLLDTEWTVREQRELTRRLRVARIRYLASLENLDS